MDAQTRDENRPEALMLIPVATALLAVGVVMVFSADATLERPLIGAGAVMTPALRHLIHAGMALVLMLGMAAAPYRALRWRSGGGLLQPPLLVVGIAVTLLVAVFADGVGVTKNGANRWIQLPGGLSFQPSETAKLALVIFAAAWFSRPGADPRRFWSGLLPVLAVLAVLAGLVGIEDFGTAALIAVVGGALLVVAGCRWWHLLLVAGPGAAALAGLVIARPYRMQRLLSFRNIYEDVEGKGYQAFQSLCTIASGDWWGRGLGAGIQKYGYLPEARSDFVFAIICEELGVIGGIGVIALFVALIWQGRRAMQAAGDRFGRLLAFGLTMVIGVQATINIAVVTVVAPTKGIALPLVSAGGSALLFTALAIGLLASVSRCGAEAAAATGETLSLAHVQLKPH